MPISQNAPCRGGSDYSNRTFTIRITDQFCEYPEDTEALLIKNQGVTDLDSITLIGKTGKEYANITDFVINNSAEFEYEWDPWTYVEALVGVFWTTGSMFKTNTMPSALSSQEPEDIESEVPFPRGGIAYALATYKIFHTKQEEDYRPGVNRTAMMTFNNLDNITVEDNQGRYFASLEEWHSRGTIKEEEAERSVWELIDIQVDGEWIPGTTFRVLPQPVTIGDNGPVPRQNAQSVIVTDGEVFEEDEVPLGPAHRSLTDYQGIHTPYKVRPSKNTDLELGWKGTGVIFRDAGYQNPFTKEAYYDYKIELDESVGHSGYEKTLWTVRDYGEILTGKRMRESHGWFYIEIEVDGEWIPGEEACLELFNIEVKRDDAGYYHEIKGPRVN